MPSQPSKQEKDWDEWFPQGKTCAELLSAREVANNSTEFLRHRLPKIGKKEIAALKMIISNAKRKTEESSPHAEVDLLDALNDLSLEDLSSYVNQEVANMKSADDDLTRRRSKGVHRVAARAQSITVAFDRFLKAYSGVVDIVKLADAQYGNIASSTLSIFFATVITKAEAEESIKDSILDIADRLPEYQVYGRIFPDKEFGHMLANAYATIIKFARNVTIYLQGHGFWRFTSHFLHIGKFEGMVEDMAKDSNRIARRSDVLLTDMVDRLEKDNEELRKREDVRLVKDLRNMLHLHDYQLESTLSILDDYRRIIKPQFDNDRRRERMTLERFHQISEYKAWRTPGASFLLVYGRNEPSREATRHSWLSPVLMEVVESLLKPVNPPITESFAQPENAIGSQDSVALEDCSERSTLEEGLSRLIFQLLRRNSKILRLADDYSYIESQIANSQNRSCDNRRVRIESLRDALLRIIDIHHRTVNIIVNRPDLCNGEEESCPEYLSVLAWLIQRTKVELKILVVVKSEQWDYNRLKKELDMPADVGRFHVAEINQHRC